MVGRENTLTIMGDGSVCPTKTTYGFLRMVPQTHMTRERHFTSHREAGERNLRTPTRRSRGGGVAIGEMEIQVATASGLSNTIREITLRGDVVLVAVCVECKRLEILCGYRKNTETVDVRLPYDMILVDCVSACLWWFKLLRI